MAKAWYAAYRPYGVRALNTNGPRADVLLRFKRKESRDTWVAHDPEVREEVKASDPKLRAALRFEEREGYRVVLTPAEFHAER
ncbi:MAG TPA: hypothetical protein VF041_23310 [Gemmatimonadaceae bacterium]